MVELFISFIFMICKNKHHPTDMLVVAAEGLVDVEQEG